MPTVGSLEIVKYRFDLVKGEPKIIIECVRVNDENGKYIRFAKLKDVIPYLSKYPVSFKEKQTALTQTAATEND